MLCRYRLQPYAAPRILEENYEGLKKFVEFLRARAPDNILRYILNGDGIATAEPPAEVIFNSRA